jgi:soluble lytic murein transglycosylase-like protein
MRKHLQLALMASSVIATSLSLTMPYVQAEAGSGESIVATTDDSGHKVYVNDSVPASSSSRFRRSDATPARRNQLVFWSVTEHRWKPVPMANVRAARSAMAEVNEYLGKNSTAASAQASFGNPARGRNFTQAEIDVAVDRAAQRHNVDPNLVRALIKVESNFNPNAVSSKGAMGLMQLMPQTARELHLTNPFDPEQNVDAGVRHLKNLMESFGGDVRLSLAAYNAGAGAVVRSAGIPPFSETRNYVRRITLLYNGGSGSELLMSDPVRRPSFAQPILVQRDAQGALSFSNTD